MSADDNISVWIEEPTGARIPIQGACSIGRLSSNTIVLADIKVSRRHATINVQGDNEFWLVDFGSGNGTYLNGRRVAQPTRLQDGDWIEIAGIKLRFHMTSSRPCEPETACGESLAEEKTFEQIKPADCWLLVADIEDSTELMKKSPEDNVPMFTSQWLNQCRALIESCGGSINKFLGDGFFAYWHHNTDTEKQVARAYSLLTKMQDAAHPVFRIVLHFGQVYMGGAGSLGEESLQGKEVHFVFRMEKLASSIAESCLVSEAARTRLPPSIQLVDAGSHHVTGFEDKYLFHARAR